MESFDVVIVGAGAAGLMCAMTAGSRGRRVLLLEHNEQAGAKILISGGGRCNFTNLEIAPERFLSANPHFCKSALSRYTQHDFIALVERHRIRYHEKTLGQLFCDGSAREILAMLLAECAAARVDLRTGHRVTEITRADRFRIETDKGSFDAPALVIATGGLSIPKMGATGFAYEIARRFDLAVIEPRPGLVPLKVTGETLELCTDSHRRFGGRDRLMRPRQLSREHFIYASRSVGSGDFADFVVLARGRHAVAQPRAFIGYRKLPRGSKARAAQGRTQNHSRRSTSDSPGACARRCCGVQSSDRECARPRSIGTGESAEAMAAQADRLRRMAESRSDGLRNRHRRALVENDGSARGAGSVCDRRSGGRYRMARRLQFPVGVVERMVRGQAV